MLRHPFKSLRSRLLLLVFLALFPALTLAICSGLEHRSQAASQVKEEARRLVRVASINEKHLIESARQFLAGLAQFKEVRGDRPEACSAFLASLLKQYPQYHNIGVANLNGDVICSALAYNAESRPVNISDRVYFQKALQSRGFAIGNHQIDRIANKASLNFGYPVLDETGRPASVVFASLDLQWFNQLALEMKLPDGAALTVRDRNGTILTRYPDPEKWVSRTISSSSILHAILSQDGEGIAEARGIDFVPRLYAFTPLENAPDGGVFLSIGIPEDIAFAESDRQMLRNVAGLSIAAALAFIAAWFGGDFFILRKVNSLVAATQKLATGELSTRVAFGSQGERSGELEQLARSIDEMAESLEERTLQLCEAEARYRTMVEQIPAITYVALPDEHRRILYISPQAEILLGYSADEWTADPEFWMKRLHPEDRSLLFPDGFSAATIPEDAPVSWEYRLMTRTGDEIWMRDEAKIVRGRDVKRILRGIMRDISERKQAEEALRQSSNKYRTIFEATGTATIIIREDSAISLANSQFVKFSGHSREELEHGKRWTEFLLEEDLKRLEGGELLDRPDSLIPHENTECRMFDRHGVLHHMLATIATIPGTPLRVASFLDISDHKRADEALRRSEERYRRFFEDDLTGVFIADFDGRLVACNPSFKAIFGFKSTDDEPMNWNLRRFFRDQGGWDTLKGLLQKKRKLEYFEMELLCPDDSSVHVVANIIGVFDGSERLTGVKGYFFDNTERKRLEEQLRHSQKMDAVGKLAGGVAHDFNNVLTVIIGCCGLIIDSPRTDHLTGKYVSEIRKAAERAASLTRQLLAFSRKQVLQPKVLNLNSAVKDMEGMLRRLIGEDVQLVSALDPALGNVKADPGQMEQVIMNLVINARDAMPKGGRTVIETANVEVDDTYGRTRLELAPGSYVMLAVSDTGVGMDQETRSQVFEPFFTTKEPGRGTGLGLSTVYGIVKQSGGHIWIYSELGVGTTFKVYFPRVDEAAQSKAPAASATAQARGTETILLVEDNDIVRDTMRETLVRRGYTVLEAQHAVEAFLVQEKHPGVIHLLVTDVVMPGMNGLELAKRLVAVRPDMQTLLVSGYTDNAILHQGVMDTEVAFLQKPFTPGSLAHKVRQVLNAPRRV